MRNISLSSVSKEAVIAGCFASIAACSLFLFFFLPIQTTKSIEQNVKRTSVHTTPFLTPTKGIALPTHIPTTGASEETSDTPQTHIIQITTIVTPTPQPVTDKAVIHLNIDNMVLFDVSLDKGKNQCDVLTQARNDNKISQLLMKYDNSLDSYGVYQINGIGTDNAVWWTYEVNGKAPSTGCNHVAANNGDTVHWQYIGSRK